MDLVKKNIHMEHTKANTATQLTFDEDMNLSENKPDCSEICFSRGWVETTDIKPLMDEVRVAGNLCFHLLYHTEENGCSLVRWEGKLPFEEKIHMDGVKPSDMVQVNGDVEDMTVGMINSRKLNVRSVVTLSVKCDELYDEEITIGIHAKEPVEYRRSPMDIAQIVIYKKDIFRLKEEFPLPANYPNIFQILWSDLTLKDMEFKLMNGRLGLQGEARVFILYEAEGDAKDVLFFERNIPFSGMIDCQGCQEDFMPDIQYRISQKDFTIRPDEDGEERSIGLEMVLEMNINIYEEEEAEVITDIYGVGCEVNSKCKNTNLQKVLGRVNGKLKLAEKIKVRGKSGGILQVVHSEGNVYVEDTRSTSDGLEVAGSLGIKVLFITGEDAMPYSSIEEQIPFRYTLEIPKLQKTDICKLQASVEQLQIQLLDGEEMEARAVLGFQTVAFRPIPIELVQEIEAASLDTENWSMLPGMVIYVVKPGDTLWNIGRRYYIPVAQIMSLNHLESDLLQVGQKLFIVKGGIG